MPLLFGGAHPSLGGYRLHVWVQCTAMDSRDAAGKYGCDIRGLSSLPMRIEPFKHDQGRQRMVEE